MKICHVTIGFGLGGAERMVQLWAEELNKMGHEVQILVMKGGFSEDVYDYIRDHNGEIHVQPLYISKASDIFWKLGGTRRYFKKFDIIHAHCLWANILAAICKGKTKFIWHEHDMDNGMKWWELALRGVFIRLQMPIDSHGNPTGGSVPGMTLRQYYAAKAMAAWIIALADRHREQGYSDDSVNVYAARFAWEAADAMIQAESERG